MLDLNSIMIGTKNPEKLAQFYEKVFGRASDWSENEYYGWKVGDTFLTIGGHSEIKGKSKEPQRIIYNLETTEVKSEFDRIKEIGAKVIKEPYEMGGSRIATFADPDGNYFQLMSPWK